MHVLFVSHYGGLYGANRSLLDLVLELRNTGIRSTVLLRRSGPVCDELDRHAVDRLLVPFENSVHRPAALSALGAIRRHAKNVRLARRHADRFRALGIDCVHTNSSTTGFGWLLSERLQVPHTWHVRESLAQHYGLSQDFGRSSFERRLLASSRAIPVSRFLSDEVLGRIPAANKQVIHDGVFTADSLARLATARQARPTPGPFTFAIVGSLEPGKNQLEAIRAAALLVREDIDFRLLVVGHGSSGYTQELDAEIERWGLSKKVERTGYLKNVDAVYARCDALLACARHEGLGRVTIEALARGIPVIGCASGATRELVINEVNGLLYSDGAAALAQRMKRLILDPELTNRLAREAPRDMERFTTQTCARAFNQMLLDVHTAAAKHESAKP